MNAADISILIVEDEGIVALDIQSSLSSKGYDVLSVVSRGEDAIATALDQKPDLILMDIRLNGDIDGIEAAQTITRHSSVPIIFLTAFTDQGTIDRAKAVAPYSFIIKPYEDTELFASIEIALNKHRLEQQIQTHQEWLQAILTNIGDAVVATDFRGRVTFMNPVAENLTQWSQEEAIDQEIDHIIPLINRHTGDEVYHPIRHAIKTQQRTLMPEDTLLVTRQEQCIPIDDSATPLYNDRGDCTGAVIIFRDISERVQAQNALFNQAFYDSLTRLPNRTLFLHRLETAIAKSLKDPQHGFALLYIDLDRFKLVNDSFGHPIGDLLLIHVTERIYHLLRPSDTQARLGGDEFAVLLDQVTDYQTVADIALRIIHALEVQFEIHAQAIHISASIGIILNQATYTTTDAIVRDADIAMYQAKSQGRGRFVVYNAQMHDHVQGMMQLERDFRLALQKKDFQVVYQPIYALKTSEIRGFEALIRWSHPERSNIPPSEFIPIAEDSGLIKNLDPWVIQQACAQMRIWQEKYPIARQMTMSVNLSGQEFHQPRIVQTIQSILRDCELPPTALNIEITEGVLLQDFSLVYETLMEFKNLGIGIYLDDFGTGYSSLSYLPKFPIDKLKIDRSFVDLLVTHKDKDEFLETIIALANSLGMPTIMEGIEHEVQYSKIKGFDCQYGQGFFLHSPATSQTIEALLESQTNTMAVQR